MFYALCEFVRGSRVSAIMDAPGDTIIAGCGTRHVLEYVKMQDFVWLAKRTKPWKHVAGA